MPKLVDHETRRREIARVHQQLVAEHGFAATTYARVAAECGLSVGTIQHYFVSRFDLVRQSFDDLCQTRNRRLVALVAQGEASGLWIKDMISQAIGELLPLDSTRRREHLVGQQLRLEAAHDPQLRTLAVAADSQLDQRVAIAIVNGKECGEVALEVDPAAGAARILACGYGLANQLQLGLTDRDPMIEQIIAPVIATVFTGACRKPSVGPSVTGRG